MTRFARYRIPLLAAVAVALGACDQGRDPLGPTDLDTPPIAAAKGGGSAQPAPVRIAFTISDGSNSRIATMNPDGSDYRVVPNTEGGYNPAWSPDRKKLAFTVAGEAAGLYVISANGTRRTRIYRADAWAASWSPDGTRIAFVASPDSAGMIIMTARPNGRDLRALTTPLANASMHTPTWSPDGTRIAYEIYQNESHTELWTMNADGTSPFRVIDCATIGAACSSPAWSPVAGNDRIVFHVRDGDARQIATIRPDGTDWQTVLYGTTYLGFDLRPAWSPDGSQIVFTSYFNGEHDLFAVNADGTDIRQLTFTADANETFPAWAR